MPSKLSHFVSLVVIAAAGSPAFAQMDVKATVLKHLQTSRDFTLKVADQMPAADYNFKLTPPQMSFGQQLVHLSQAFDEFLSPMTGGTAAPGKPASMSKQDVIAFMRKSFDDAIASVSKLTPAQLAKTYNTGEGTSTGLDVLLELLDPHYPPSRFSRDVFAG